LRTGLITVMNKNIVYYTKHLIVCALLMVLTSDLYSQTTCLPELAKQANLELRYADAINYYKACHIQGNPEATTMLGMTYVTAYYGNTDFERAKELFNEALAKDEYKANLGLAYYYMFHPDNPDSALAYTYFEDAIPSITYAADSGDVYWATRLAYLYGNGYGTYKDEEKAVELLRSVLYSNYAIAQNNMAFAFLNANGVAFNNDSAYYYFSLAQAGGFEYACAGLYDVGRNYLFGINCAIDLLKAEESLNKANACKYKDSGRLLGLTYFYLEKQEKAKQRWEAGYINDTIYGFYLAYYYLKATETDYNKARELLKSLKNYSPDSYGSLDYLYSLLYGDPNEVDFYDLEKSWTYLQQAHEKGYSFFFEPGNAIKPGGKIKELLLPDTTGINITLSNVEGKYILIDFWASWCGPCRKENPNLISLYNKYKDKGFEIISISLDNNKNRWINAIKSDSLSWIHVSDLKGWNSMASWIYNVRSIPASYLVDSNGNVVEVGLRGYDLRVKLVELFEEE